MTCFASSQPRLRLLLRLWTALLLGAAALFAGPALLFAPALLVAQDTRTVTEPHLPPACVVLRARLSAPGGALSAKEERRADTARIQKAIDGCAAGQAVELRAEGAKAIFLSGPIRLKAGVTLLVDANTALFASRNPRNYDLQPDSCGVLTGDGHGCKPFILADHAPNSAIMGDGSIDGRGGEKLLGQNVTWWDLAHTAKVEDKNQSCPQMVMVRDSDNFILYRITLRNAPQGHVFIADSDGFTAWGVKIDTPGTARNTDGIDPSSSSNVTITHSYIHAGDDDVAITSHSGRPAAHITVEDDHFYTGHGMSIGSRTAGGVSDVRVSDLTIDGAANGIRIKSDRSRGGLVNEVVYSDVCMRGVAHPIVLTPHYTTFSGSLLPVYRGIVLRNVHSLDAGLSTVSGLDAARPLEVTFDNVVVDGVQPADIQASDAQITLGPGLGNFAPAGNDVSVTQAAGSAPATAYDCAGRFVDFPADKTAPASLSPAPPVDKNLYVAADGTGDFYSVQQAIDAAPADGATVLIAPGVYREVVTIHKPNIHMRSSNPDASKTVIVFNKSAGDSGGAFHSATVNVTGDDFSAENLTFQNDWNATHKQVPVGSQALALSVTGDKAFFKNVRLLGNQDTLYAANPPCPRGQVCKPSRQYFTDCYIAGNVDFIFGNSKAVFDHCEIHSTPHSEGMLTAQSKNSPDQDSGYVFNHCKLTADPGVTNVYLGRPWRPYATVIYLNTYMGPQIMPAGWSEWHAGQTHSLDTAFYAEYHSTGPGAHPGEREPKSKPLTAAEAAQYETVKWLEGWNPTAGDAQ